MRDGKARPKFKQTVPMGMVDMELPHRYPDD